MLTRREWVILILQAIAGFSAFYALVKLTA